MRRSLILLAWLIAGPVLAQQVHEHHPRAGAAAEKFSPAFARFAK